MNSNSPSSNPNAARRRWLLWLLLLALTLSAMAWLDDSETESDDARGRTRRPQRTAEQVLTEPREAYADARHAAASRLALALERLQLPETGGSVEAATDLFATRNWQPAPPPLRPVAAKAPALPFKVLGRLVEDDAAVVFLANQNRNFIAREGEVLDNTYRVERIENERMTLIYLPLAERQILHLGAVN